MKPFNGIQKQFFETVVNNPASKRFLWQGNRSGKKLLQAAYIKNQGLELDRLCPNTGIFFYRKLTKKQIRNRKRLRQIREVSKWI